MWLALSPCCQTSHLLHLQLSALQAMEKHTNQPKNQDYDFIQIAAISGEKKHFHYNMPLFSNSKAIVILTVIIMIAY